MVKLEYFEGAVLEELLVHVDKIEQGCDFSASF
jgi:hypothetical protein